MKIRKAIYSITCAECGAKIPAGDNYEVKFIPLKDSFYKPLKSRASVEKPVCLKHSAAEAQRKINAINSRPIQLDLLGAK